MITDLINAPFNNLISKSTEPIIEEKGFTIIDRAKDLVAPGEMLFKVSLPNPRPIEDRARDQAKTREASQQDSKVYWLGVKYFVKGFLGSSRSFSESRVRIFSTLPLTDKEKKAMTGLEKTYSKKDLASCLDDFLASQRATEVKEALPAKEKLPVATNTAETEQTTVPSTSAEPEAEQAPISSSNEEFNTDAVASDLNSSESSEEAPNSPVVNSTQDSDNELQEEQKSELPS